MDSFLRFVSKMALQFLDRAPHECFSPLQYVYEGGGEERSTSPSGLAIYGAFVTSNSSQTEYAMLFKVKRSRNVAMACPITCIGSFSSLHVLLLLVHVGIGIGFGGS